MKLAYIGIVKNDGPEARELAAEHHLEGVSRWTQKNVIEFMTFHAELIAKRTPLGVRQDVEEKGYLVRTHAHSAGICGVVITDLDYPKLAAHSLIDKIVDEFVSKYPRTAYANFQKDDPKLQMPEFKNYITKFQNPEEADNIMKIQKELDETKIVLHKTVESLLQRGEKIDDLVAKSDGLSASSKMFYTQAKKQNSCCTVM